MKSFRFASSIGIAVALGFVLAGCNGSASLPGAPSPSGTQGAGKAASGASASATSATVEFTGTVQSIAPPSLQVSGRTVVTDASTEFHGRIRSLADLRVGDTVKVEGRVRSVRTIVLAREIKRLDRQVQRGEVELEGSIEAVTPPSLRVAGRTVVTDADTRIERDDHQIRLTDLKVGETVEVEGLSIKDGILARKIEVGHGEDQDGDHDDGDHDDGDHDDGDHEG